MFTLRRDGLRPTLSQLRECNVCLRSIVYGANDMLADRAREYPTRVRLAQSVQPLFQALYDAFCRTKTYNDFGARKVGIGMAPSDNAVFQNPEEEAVSSFDIGVLIESHCLTSSPHWHYFRVRWIDNYATEPSISPLSEGYSPKTPRKARLSFSNTIQDLQNTAQASESKAKTDVRSSSPAGLRFTLQAPASPITDLCHLLQESKDDVATSSPFGYVFTDLGRFIYNTDQSPGNTKVVTLHTILDGHHAGVTATDLSYTKRLALALALSYGVLYLHDTSWLEGYITSDDIHFLGQQQASGGHEYHLNRPLLVRSVTDFAATFDSSEEKSSPKDKSIISLGLLLIQIITGSHIPDFAAEQSESVDSFFHQRSIASGMMASVLQSGGASYARSVQWCLDNALLLDTETTETVRQGIEARVIAPLEQNYKLSSISLDGTKPFWYHGEMPSTGKQADRPSAQSGGLFQGDDFIVRDTTKERRSSDARIITISDSSSASESRMFLPDSTIPSSVSTRLTSTDNQTDSLSADLAYMLQQEDDTRTRYTTRIRLPSNKLDLIISEFADMIYTNICGRYSQETGEPFTGNWVQRLHLVLPEVLRSFAIQLGHDVHGQGSSRKEELFDAMRFIHGNRQ